MFLILIKNLFLVGLIASVIYFFIVIKYIKDPGKKHGAIFIAAFAFIGFLVTSVLVGQENKMTLKKVNSSYTTDDTGTVVIDGQYSSAPNYKTLTVEVYESGKMINDKEATVTLVPSTKSFKIIYAMPPNQEKTKLKLAIKNEGQAVEKEITVNKVEDVEETGSSEPKKTVKTSTELSNQAINESTSSEVKVTNSEEKESQTRELKFDTFNSIKSSVIDRLNVEVEPKKMKKVVAIEGSQKEIKVTLSNNSKSLTKQQKEVLAGQIGEQVIGLFRGSVTNGQPDEDIPIQAVYEDGKEFAKSTHKEAIKLKLSQE